MVHNANAATINPNCTTHLRFTGILCCNLARWRWEAATIFMMVTKQGEEAFGGDFSAIADWFVQDLIGGNWSFYLQNCHVCWSQVF